MTTHIQGKGNVNQSKHSSGRNFQKVFVAVDYMASTPEVFEKALGLAKIHDSSLMVFYCLQGQIPGLSESPVFATGMGAYGGVYSTQMVQLEEKLFEEGTEELKAWLGSFAQIATEEGIPVETDYSIGEAGKQICEAAKRWGADLIVVGRRGRKGLTELLLGSVSNYVIHHAHCSVLVVQSD